MMHSDKSLYHQNMKKLLMIEFPNLRLKQINFLKNKISNSLRKLKTDIFAVYLSAKPLSLHGYINSYTISSNGVIVYIYVRVD